MKILHTGLALAMMTAWATAGETVRSSYTPIPLPPPTISLYNAGEWQVDLFGNYAFTDSGNERLIDNHVWGGGIAFNYFFTRNFGLGVEGSLFDTDGSALATAALDLYWRFPIEETGWAPYLFGGVGLTFNASEVHSGDFEDFGNRVQEFRDYRDGDDVLALGHVGAGVEYRFSPHVGIFTDARYTWTGQDDSDFAVARAGVRFAF